MSEFSVYYLGNCCIPLKNKESQNVTEVRSNEEKVIDVVEVEQLDGSIAKDSKGLDQVTLRISRNGVQLFDPNTSHVVARIPLVNVVFSVSYHDGFNKFNCIIVENVRDSDELCKCHLLQVFSKAHSEEICCILKTLFEDVQIECQRFDDDEESDDV
ncbi:unnamed protein product [Auanema sp. JU1783]|nr:unnamed protein product [Auanema sp. JU1783]